MDPAQGRWDVTKMNYIGSFAPVNTAFMIHKGSKLASAADLFKGKTNVGCSGRASQSFQYPATLKVIAKMPLNIICGYDGSSAYTLALLRGEVDIVSKAWNSARAEDKDNIDNGTFIPLLQAGLKRTPELPNVPLMQEIVDDPSAKKAIEFVSAGAAIGRALLAPQNVPADRLAALRAAFDKVVVDKDFLADAQKRSIYIEPTPGADVQKYSATPSSRRRRTSSIWSRRHSTRRDGFLTVMRGLDPRIHPQATRQSALRAMDYRSIPGSSPADGDDAGNLMSKGLA